MSSNEYFREWTRKNPERARAIKRRWREANPEKQDAARKAWSERNHQRELDKGHRYRARKRGGYVEKVNRLAIYERDSGVCWICEEAVEQDAFELDHVLPISLGGPHSAANVRLAHRSCNAKRGNRGITVFDPGPVPDEWHDTFADIPPGGAVLDCGRKGMWMVMPIPERGLR